MLPIDNQNYGLLYSFQPNYLEDLIHEDERHVSHPGGFSKSHMDIFEVLNEYMQGLAK